MYSTATTSYQKTFKDDFNIALSGSFVTECFEQSLRQNEYGLTTITSKNKLVYDIHCFGCAQWFNVSLVNQSF